MISIFQTYHLSTLPLEVRNKTGLLKMCEALCLRTHPLTNLEITRKLMSNERQRIPKGQSQMDNPEKLTTNCTQDKLKHNTICVGHHYPQTT